VEAVRADVLQFCRPLRPRDDMTLMVVARCPDLPPAPPPSLS
jgi:hypothetical protein